MRTLVPLLVTILAAIYHYKPPSATAQQTSRQEIPLNYSTIYRIILANKYFAFEAKTHTLNFENDQGNVSSLSIARRQEKNKENHYRYGYNGSDQFLFNYDYWNDVLIYYFAFVEEGLIIKFEYLNRTKETTTHTHNVTGRVKKMWFDNLTGIVSASYLPEKRIRHFLNCGTWDLLDSSVCKGNLTDAQPKITTKREEKTPGGTDLPTEESHGTSSDTTTDAPEETTFEDKDAAGNIDEADHPEDHDDEKDSDGSNTAATLGKSTVLGGEETFSSTRGFNLPTDLDQKEEGDSDRDDTTDTSSKNTTFGEEKSSGTTNDKASPKGQSYNGTSNGITDVPKANTAQRVQETSGTIRQTNFPEQSSEEGSGTTDVSEKSTKDPLEVDDTSGASKAYTVENGDHLPAKGDKKTPVLDSP